MDHGQVHADSGELPGGSRSRQAKLFRGEQPLLYVKDWRTYHLVRLVDILDCFHEACLDAVKVLLASFGGRERHSDVLKTSELEGEGLVAIDVLFSIDQQRIPK